MRMAEQRRRGGFRGDEAAILEAASVNADWSVHDSLEELAKLCETARLRVCGRTYQRLESANGQTMVGKGKLEEIATAIIENEADAIIFDDELNLAQQRNILSELINIGNIPASTQILDRTQLVLQIFSERAKTREAKTQVALARAEYMLPRLATFMTTGAGMELRGGSAGGGSGGGGAYLRGAGETQLEMDKRLFGKRIQRLRSELESIASKRQATRKRNIEQTQDIPLIALVGYTNAGKTSLLNALVDATAAARSDEQQLYADDKLFATLDPTTRRIILPRGRVCKFTDTVGFLQKLPTRLIASFRATLEEINDACLLIHVVDASSDLAKRHVDAVNAIISQLGASDIPQIRCLNKLDRYEENLAASNDNDHVDPAALEIGARVIARTSATSGDGIHELLEQIEDALSSMNEPITALVPFTEGHLLNMVYTKGTVIELEHLDSGTRIHARVPPTLRAKLLEFAVDEA